MAIQASLDIRLDSVRLFKNLPKYEKELISDLKKLTTVHSKNTKTLARRNAPVTPTVWRSPQQRASNGSLRNSIRVRDTSRQAGRQRGLAKTVVARRRYGGGFRHLVEHGSSRRTTNADGPFRVPIRTRGGFKWRTVSDNRGAMRSQPFMTPAQEQVRPLWEAQVAQRVLRRVIL